MKGIGNYWNVSENLRSNYNEFYSNYEDT